MTRRKLIAGNWKMNGLSGDGVALARAVAEQARLAPAACDLLLCPPATLIDAVIRAVAGSAVMVGGQDCHEKESGAHTGDVSAPMLTDLGCRAVIVGHSERRAAYGESDARVAAKALAAHRAGLIAIICIGETEAERDQGNAVAVVEAQLAGSLPEGADALNSVIAYEPVWAIGSGRTPTLLQVAEIHAAIRTAAAKRLGEDEAAGLRILYGGSMKSSNAESLLALPDVDGGLIGGASLKAEEFGAIAAACR